MRLRRVLFTLPIVALMGCSKFSPSHSTTQSSTCAGFECDNVENLGALTSNQSALLSQNQILKSYSKCLNVAPSTTTLATYNRLKTSLSTEGKITDFSAPVGLSALVIAGDICRDLVVKEAALDSTTRTFFKTGGALTANFSTVNNALSSMKASAQALSTACLGRALTSQESSEIEIGLTGAQFPTTGTMQQSSLFVCSAVLGSLAGQQL